LLDFTTFTETCDWFNELLNSLYFDLIGSEQIRQLILSRIMLEFKDLQAEYPSLLVRALPPLLPTFPLATGSE